MLECGTTNPEPARTVQKTATRFDPRRVYTVCPGSPAPLCRNFLSSSSSLYVHRGCGW